MYEEGWQSWTPAGVHAAAGTSPRPRTRLEQTMGWRPDVRRPARGFQGEGLLALASPGEPVRVWFSPEPRKAVASIRLEAKRDHLVVWADGPVAELVLAGRLVEALGAVGDPLAAPSVWRAGVWKAPLLVGAHSALAAQHPTRSSARPTPAGTGTNVCGSWT